MESSCDSSTAKEGVKSDSRSKLVSVEESKEENVASGVKRKLQEALATDTDDGIAVVGDGDDFEFTMESLSAVEFAGYLVSLFWDESSLALRMRDNLSKRLFTAKYSHSQLVTDMKFPALMSCEAICALVSHSMEGSSESLACSSEQTGANKIALILKHTVIEGHSIEYRIQLTEVSQKETDVLLAIIADLRNDISASQQRGDEMQSIVCRMQKRHESMDAEMNDLKAQMGPSIASYRSKAMVGRFRKWDTVELAPTKEGMIHLNADQSEFEIRDNGLYRVRSVVSINLITYFSEEMGAPMGVKMPPGMSGVKMHPREAWCELKAVKKMKKKKATKALNIDEELDASITDDCSSIDSYRSRYVAQLQVNGTVKCQTHGKYEAGSPLCFVGRLKVGDKIKVYISIRELNEAQSNWIQIEKL